MPVSSNRLGQRPFKPQTRVQVPLLVPNVPVRIKVLYRAVNAEKRGQYSHSGPTFLPSLIGRATDSGSVRSSFKSKGRSQKFPRLLIG